MYVKIYFVIILYFFKYTSASTCKFNVKLKQLLLNEGFHRNITYEIVFQDNSIKDRWLYKDCIIGLDQVLPPGVYANPDELSDLRRMRKLNAIPKNRINIELPAAVSEPSSVYLMSRMIDHKVNLWLPVHARYHQVVPDGGTAINRIGPPKLYFRCPDQRLDACDEAQSPSATFLCNGSSKEKCSWKDINFTLLTPGLRWPTPVGDTHHYTWVAAGTAFVIVIVSLYLLNTVHHYKLAIKSKLS